MIEPRPATTALPTTSPNGPFEHRLAGYPATDADNVRLLASVDRSHAQWRRLWLGLQSITPSGVARGLLLLGAAAAAIWLLATTWFALVPFQVGLALAYITLPLVNRLNRVMPRVMAALLVVLLQVATVVGFVVGLIPPLGEQLSALGRSLPSAVDVRAALEQLRAWVETLPPPMQTAILSTVSQATAFAQDNASELTQRALELLVLGSFTVLNWLGFMIGFVAVPTFLLAVMQDQPAGVRAVNRAVPASVRQDFWAILRIVDRTLSSYLRGQMLRAFVFGAAITAGQALLETWGFAGARYPLLLGMIAAVTYLIPTIGWLIGAIPAVLLALTQSQETAVAELALYAGVAFLETQMLSSRIASRSIDIHPVILMPALVVASQFNLLLLILAAPLLVVARDLFRYVYGRLSDPPLPAGVMPDRASAIALGRRPPGATARRTRRRWSGQEYPQPLQTDRRLRG